MKGYFEGDKNVLVFKPIPKGRPGRKKKQTHFERIMNGTKEDVVNELEAAIRWARDLSEGQWKTILSNPGGLRAFIYETMEK